MILKILTIVFVTLVLAKYVFNAKIHEKYIFGVAALLALATNFGKQHSAIEMFDGSSVAFDKEAFENLNRIVNEIAGDGRLTVPGNLIVKGTAKFEKDCTLDKKLTVKDTSTFEKDCTLKKKLTVKDTSTFEKDCTMKKKLTVKDTSTFEKDCTLNKKLTVKDTSTFEKDCTLKKKLTVKDTSTFDKDCTLKKKLTVQGGSRFSGDRHLFKDSENKGQVRVGAFYGFPGIGSHDGKSSFLIASGQASDNPLQIITKGNKGEGPVRGSIIIGREGKHWDYSGKWHNIGFNFTGNKTELSRSKNYTKDI